MRTESPETPTSSVHHYYFYSWGLFVVLLVINFVFWQITKNNVKLQAKEKFSHQVSEVINGINHHSEEFDSLMEAGVSYFASSSEVTRKDFTQFYSKFLDIEKEVSPGIAGVAFVETVNSVPDYISRIRQDRYLDPDGLPNFSIFPTSQVIPHHIFNYLVPHDKNASLFGYDLTSDPVQHKIVESLDGDKNFAVTGKLTLLNTPRITIYQSLKNDKSEQLGYLVLILNPDTLFDGKFEDYPNSAYFEYKLLDGSEQIYENSLGEVPKNSENENYLTETRPLNFFGKNLTVEIRSPQRQHINTFLYYFPDFIFIAGGIVITIIFTLISSVVFYSHENPGLKISVNTLFGQAPSSPNP